jgi:hypothetical protein
MKTIAMLEEAGNGFLCSIVKIVEQLYLFDDFN